MIHEIVKATRNILNSNDSLKSKLLMEKVLETLQLTESVIESFNGHKRFCFYPMFFVLIAWMNQGTKYISSLFFPIEGSQTQIGFKKICLYDKLSIMILDWSSLAHYIMKAVAIYLLSSDLSLTNSFLIIDDSNIDRGRSKHIELGNTKLFDHNKKTFSQCVNLLQIGIVVHNYFTPLAFNLIGTTKDKYRIKELRQIDRRTKAGRRRKDATISKNRLALNMPDKLKNSEFAMLTVLCNS